mmetsp:Transcript_69483/g.175173  ORF Transcript_69483/g.175173 Transcript_69483/m.175173 type:complete len:225 (+) Transcript_69483:51-725(+)
MAAAVTRTALASSFSIPSASTAIAGRGAADPCNSVSSSSAVRVASSFGGRVGPSSSAGIALLRSALLFSGSASSPEEGKAEGEDRSGENEGTSFINPTALATLVGGGRCAICLEPVWPGRAIAITSCGHVFHMQCLSRADTRTCPQCRALIDSLDEQEQGLEPEAETRQFGFPFDSFRSPLAEELRLLRSLQDLFGAYIQEDSEPWWQSHRLSVLVRAPRFRVV